MNNLLITRRRIPQNASDKYMQLWNVVRDAAEAQGARAWIFRAVNDATHFTEFVEWRQTDVLQHIAMSAALHEINDAFPSEESDTWTELKP